MKVGILVTGGMDSTALLYRAAHNEHDVYPITIDYGHTAFAKQQELLCWHISNLQTRKRGKVHSLITVPILFNDFQRHSNALFDPIYQCNEVSPLEEWDQMRYEKSLVEGRNAIMVLYALGFCASEKIDELWAGYLYSEKEWENRFTTKLLLGDNSPQFVDTINVLSLMGFSHSVRFRAPFYEERMNKSDAYYMGLSLGVDYDKTYSCYFSKPCGKCDNCLLRQQILGDKENS